MKRDIMAEKAILLVEDNPDDELLTLRALNKNRISNPVIVAHDGAEALDYLFGTGQYAGRDLHDQPALILLDLKLPKVDGLEVLRRVKEDPRMRLVPVVVLTTSNEQTDIAQGYRFGANSYIRKPVDFERFNEAIGRLARYWFSHNAFPPDTDFP
jgi:two-component system, response regulator